jgi:Icc-related predicted phosphoesterase
MTILALADQPPSRSVKQILAENRIDLICTLGDFEQSQLQELASVTTIPKIGIYGNHCSGMYFGPLGIKNMHLATFEFGGLTFGGFEGCVRYKQSVYAKMYTQEEATELLKDFPRVDVLLTHCPAFGINDEPDEVAHQGFKALRVYLETKKPAYHFHGHTYPPANQLVTSFGETKIVYVTGEKIVSI